MPGFMNRVFGGIRSWFGRDKEQVQLRLAQGATAATLPGSAYDMLQSYGYDVVADYLKLEQDLMSRFIDYETMDDYPEVSAALNIYADDATQPDTPGGRRVWVESPDRDIAQLGNDLFHRTLRLEDRDLWEIARSTSKTGNDYEEILVAEEGVVGLNHLPAHSVRRIEGPRGELYGFVQDFKRRIGFSPKEFQDLLSKRFQFQYKGPGQPNELSATPPRSVGYNEVIPFENWQVAHFRMRAKHRRSVYGWSILEPARWIWKRLILLEDAALVYRLQRAPERFAFYVDTGNLPPHEALKMLHKIRQQYKKKKFVNPITNQRDLRFDALAQDEDFFVPVINGTEATRIELLGGPNWQHMEDIEYFLRKLFAAMQVPKAYFSQEEGVNRAILSSEDVRFARTVMRLQQCLREGLEKVFRVHLAALGIPPDNVEFEVKFTVPSSIFELAQLEVKNARADWMSRMREHVSLQYALKHGEGLTDDEIRTIMDQRDEEAVRQGAIEGQAQALMQKAMMAAQGGQEGGGGFESRAPYGNLLLGGRRPRLFTGTPRAPYLIGAGGNGISERVPSGMGFRGDMYSNTPWGRLVREQSRIAAQVREIRMHTRELNRRPHHAR